MRWVHATLLLALLGGACGSGDSPSASASLTPEQVRGNWTFVRTGASSCVPETVNVRLTTAFYSVAARDTLDVSGDWTSNRDARVRVFTGVVARAGDFQWLLTRTEGMRGRMDQYGNAKAAAYCADGSMASLDGTRRT